MSRLEKRDTKCSVIQKKLESFALRSVSVPWMEIAAQSGICYYKVVQLTFHSKAPTAIPEAAPVPASPIKCELPMFDEKSENATGKNHIERPASRKSVALPDVFFPRHEMPKPVPRMTKK